MYFDEIYKFCLKYFQYDICNHRLKICKYTQFEGNRKFGLFGSSSKGSVIRTITSKKYVPSLSRISHMYCYIFAETKLFLNYFTYL